MVQALDVVVFLHGYATPGDPPDSAVAVAFASVGADVEVCAPVGPQGSSRVDPFNPEGRASWFRYATDLTLTVPQRPDLAELEDVHDSLYGYPFAGNRRGLIAVVEDVCSSSDSRSVAIVGESQGGIMAAFLARAWSQIHPDDPLGGLGLVRTAPDPSTWRDLRPASAADWPRGEGHLPESLAERVALVLGGDDEVFRPYAALYAIGPIVDAQPAAVASRVLPGVTHASHSDLVFETLAQMLVGAPDHGVGGLTEQ
ncbi:MAG: Phospholipase/Carboxylesterase [Actinomycetota bacterium]